MWKCTLLDCTLSRNNIKMWKTKLAADYSLYMQQKMMFVKMYNKLKMFFLFVCLFWPFSTGRQIGETKWNNMADLEKGKSEWVIALLPDKRVRTFIMYICTNIQASWSITSLTDFMSGKHRLCLFSPCCQKLVDSSTFSHYDSNDNQPICKCEWHIHNYWQQSVFIRLHTATV